MLHKGLRLRFKFVLFLMVLVPLLLIHNETRNGDQYVFALYIDSCYRTLHSAHLYNAFLTHIVWWVLGLFGVAVSPLHVLDVTSALMSAVGAVALIDLGVFWGLEIRTAVLFSLPIILSNAFMRYGTSAYPGSVALGAGLISMNLLMRAMDHPSEKGSSYKKIFWAGLWMGMAGIMHSIALELVPGILVGIFYFQYPENEKMHRGIRMGFWYASGVVTTVITGYIAMLAVYHFYPDHVVIQGPYSGTIMELAVGKLPHWFPGFSDVTTELKTFGALFFPGVHSSNRLLGILFNIPRLSAALLILISVFLVWRRKKEMPGIHQWMIPLGLCLVTQFVIMLFCTFALCRQYALISFIVLGPAFLILGICLRHLKKSFASITMGVMALACAIYMIWGIEGIFYNMNRDPVSAAYYNLYLKYPLDKPKIGYLPWDASRCTFAHTDPLSPSSCSVLAKYSSGSKH